MFGLECALNVEFNPAEMERVFMDAKANQVQTKQYAFHQSKGLIVTGRVDGYEPESIWLRVESAKSLAPTLSSILERTRYRIFRTCGREETEIG